MHFCCIVTGIEVRLTDNARRTTGRLEAFSVSPLSGIHNFPLAALQLALVAAPAAIVAKSSSSGTVGPDEKKPQYIWPRSSSSRRIRLPELLSQPIRVPRLVMKRECLRCCDAHATREWLFSCYRIRFNQRTSVSECKWNVLKQSWGYALAMVTSGACRANRMRQYSKLEKRYLALWNVYNSPGLHGSWYVH